MVHVEDPKVEDAAKAHAQGHMADMKAHAQDHMVDMKAHAQVHMVDGKTDLAVKAR